MPQVPGERGPMEFWEALDQLVAEGEVVIDRPAGSAHPRYPALVYPLDYGYLEGTTAADGAGIDVWCGKSGRSEVTAVVCTIDLHKRDAEIKLLLGCTSQEELTVLEFHNSGTQAAMLVRREGG